MTKEREGFWFTTRGFHNEIFLEFLNQIVLEIFCFLDFSLLKYFDLCYNFASAGSMITSSLEIGDEFIEITGR